MKSVLGGTPRRWFQMVKVFLVDDHEVVRRGLIDLLNVDPELEVVAKPAP